MVMYFFYFNTPMQLSNSSKAVRCINIVLVAKDPMKTKGSFALAASYCESTGYSGRCHVTGSPDID